MRRAQLITALALLMLTITQAAETAPATKPRTVTYEPGQEFCPKRALLAKNVVVQPGRCYALFVLRDNRGTFLAFASPEAKIPPGQLVRLTTPEGTKFRSYVFYLVPLVTTVTLVPNGMATSAAVRETDEGTQLSLTILGKTPAITVTFAVRQ